MPLAVRCPKCAKDYRLGDELAGRTVRCNCGQRFVVDLPPAIGPADSLLELLDDADRHAADQLNSEGTGAGAHVEVQSTHAPSELGQAYLERLRVAAEQDIVRIFGTRAAGSRLQIACDTFQQDFTGTLLKFQVRGQLCGRTVKKTITAKLKSVGAGGVEGAIGGALGTLVVRGLGTLTSRDQPRANPQLENCFHACQAHLRLFLEEQVPRSASAGPDRYQQVKWSSIGAGVIFSLVAAVALYNQMPQPDWTIAFLFGAMGGGVFGMSAYFAIMSLMPMDFFLNTPRGRWLSSKHVGTNLMAMRMQFLFIAMLGIFWAIGCAAFPTIGAAFKRHFPDAQARQLGPPQGRP